MTTERAGSSTGPMTDSAIAKDREVAAKATRGEWVAGPTPGYLGMMQTKDGKGRKYDPVTIRSPKVHTEELVTCWTYLMNPHSNAEHIVRLHNRFPAYSALVDAVRDWTACYGFEGDRLTLLHEALRALDQEDTNA